MSNGADTIEVQLALDELQQYLSDHLPPLVVCDSISLLIGESPELVATTIHAWIRSQHGREGSALVSDYLYHAVAKIHLMQEYKLIAAEELLPYINRLKPVILKLCPVEERDHLNTNLEMLGSSEGSPLGAGVDHLFRPPMSLQTRSATPAPDFESLQQIDFRRVAPLLRRFQKRAPPSAQGATAVMSQDEVFTDVLAQAARTAADTADLNSMVEYLERLGMKVGPDDLIGALGRTLPAWSFPNRPDLEVPESSNLQAMQRIIAKAPNSQQAATRFHHLMKSAIERFNEGAIVQSASMIDLAKRIIEAKHIDSQMVEITRSKGHEQLSFEALRKYAADDSHHIPLRKILNFFVALNPEPLLASLRTESKRENRRLTLELLQAHGETARAFVIKCLSEPADRNLPDEELYFRRNLLYLIRHIPASPDESADTVAEAVLAHADFSFPPMLTKEAFACLTTLKHDKVEQGLKKLLQRAEQMLSNPQQTKYESQEVLQLLDRIVSALCRIGTPKARAAAIDHAMSKKANLGDTLGRIADLSRYDLIEDSESVDRLLFALKSNLPLKRLGIYLAQRDYNAAAIVEALAGTTASEVRYALEQLARQYPERKSGQAAANALTNMEKNLSKRPQEPQAVSLMGDLELFGLAALLQNLADTGVTGVLTLKSPQNEPFATLTLENGLLLSCSNGAYTGHNAFYQLFERPRPGRFEFVRTAEHADASEADLHEMLPLMLEAMRRYDELQQARAIVPDDMPLRTKSAQPPRLPEEKDGLLFRMLWTAVKNGATALECEASLAVDSFRIRRLLVYWVEGGAIEVT